MTDRECLFDKIQKLDLKIDGINYNTLIPLECYVPNQERIKRWNNLECGTDLTIKNTVIAKCSTDNPEYSLVETVINIEKMEHILYYDPIWHEMT